MTNSVLLVEPSSSNLCGFANLENAAALEADNTGLKSRPDPRAALLLAHRPTVVRCVESSLSLVTQFLYCKSGLEGKY